MFAKMKKNSFVNKALGDVSKSAKAVASGELKKSARVAVNKMAKEAKQAAKNVVHDLSGKKNSSSSSSSSNKSTLVVPAAAVGTPVEQAPSQQGAGGHIVTTPLPVAETNDKTTLPIVVDNDKNDPSNDEPNESFSNPVSNDETNATTLSTTVEDQPITTTLTTTTTTTTTTEDDGATDQVEDVMDVTWNQHLLQLVNERRAQLDTQLPPIEWSDCIYEQCLPVARSNAAKGENRYGDKVAIKAAIQNVHKACKGTFKVTTQTLNVQNATSTQEALQNFIDSQGHWGMLIHPDNKMGAFAAVQKNGMVYWIGIFIKLWPNRPNS